MKKALLALFAVLALAMPSNAQKTELTFSYGGYTLMDAADYHDGWHDVNTAWGAVNFGVNFKVAPKLWVGPSYTFSSATTKGGPNHSSIAYHAIMLNARYEYYRNSIVKLYAHMGIGGEISHMMPKHADSYNKGYFAMQLSPLGAQVDISRDFALFGELGFGAQGLLQVGFKVKL